MRQCCECRFYSSFYHSCRCPAKNAVYARPLDMTVRASGEAPACSFFVDIDEVAE